MPDKLRLQILQDVKEPGNLLLDLIIMIICRKLRTLLTIHLISILLISGFCSCGNNAKPLAGSPSWCDKKPRPGLEKLTEIKTNRPWFKVYDTGNGVYAILEPYNYQEVISYLITGKQKALLFDTGMGLDSISPLIKALTKLPVIVLNSHTHHDHVGGNHEFNYILAMNTDFTKKNAAIGYSHALVREEVTPASFCLRCLPKTDTTNYSISPFKISEVIDDRHVIDLGGRQLQVIATPGHTPDAISLFDKENGYLWTGDTFYEGPIFLFDKETDLNAYQKSIKKLAWLAPSVKWALPAHNLPLADPHELIEANDFFIEIKNGSKKGASEENNTLSFKSARFSFLIGKDLLK